MMILTIFTLYVIEKNALSNQRSGLEDMVHDLGSLAASSGGALPKVPNMAHFLDERASQNGLRDRPIMFILDQEGVIIQQFPPDPPDETAEITTRLSEIMSGETHIIALKSKEDREPFIVGVHPITIESTIIGYALYVVVQLNVLDGILEFKYPRFILLISFILISWAIIYVMTRRLIKPIQEAAKAAQHIVDGNYDIHVNKEHKEKEIYELMYSFKEMADRLNRLESLRTQLLAGVTHELQTPVTSISGLVQAVRKKVVKGEEADVFLDHCLNDCDRLQKMVEDLLDFNSYASGAITVKPELIDLKSVMREIIARWRHGQAHLTTEIVMENLDESVDWHVYTDPFRLEQIMINLLNNARDAMAPGRMVVVRLNSVLDQFHIRVQDTGCGIPNEEQQDVFEPFYRGMEKKTRVRGLGLGLPFSRMLTRSMGGDLVLTDSSPIGTAFTIHIPKNEAKYIKSEYEY